jgi:hypothetical protein
MPARPALRPCPGLRRCGRRMWCATLNELPPIRFQTAKTISDVSPCSRGTLRPSCGFIFRPLRGRGECRVPDAPAASCAIVVVERTRVTTSTPERPAFPHAMVLTAYVGLSPVTGLFCHRHSQSKVLSLPGWAKQDSANLTPASGRQDHTILPSAAIVSRQRAIDCSQIQRTRPAIPSHAKRCRVHRIRTPRP